MSKKRPDTSAILSELTEQSEFFKQPKEKTEPPERGEPSERPERDERGERPERDERNEPSEHPEREERSERSKYNEEINENESVVQTIKKKRITHRQSFDLYQDQVISIEQLKRSFMMQGELKSKSSMVREAIDDYLEKHKSRTPRT